MALQKMYQCVSLLEDLNKCGAIFHHGLINHGDQHEELIDNIRVDTLWYLSLTLIVNNCYYIYWSCFLLRLQGRKLENIMTLVYLCTFTIIMIQQRYSVKINNSNYNIWRLTFLKWSYDLQLLLQCRIVISFKGENCEQQDQ